MTMRLALDVAEYLDTVKNKAQTVEEAVRLAKELKSQTEQKDK